MSQIIESRSDDPGNAAINKIYMAATTFCRMAVGFGIFVVLAKTLGPKSFGFVTGVFAYASIFGLITDFGFASKNLRDIAADPGGGRHVLLDTLELKGFLTLAVLALGCVIILKLPFPWEDKVGAAMLGIGVFVNSFGGLGVSGLRAIGKFRDEAWITCWTSVIYAGFTAIAVIVWPQSIVAIGLAFFLSRVIYASAAIVASWRKLGARARIRSSRISTALSTASGGITWAVDNGLVVLSSQLDAVLVAHFGTLAQLGTYQAGARIVENAYSLAGVMAVVHIPALSRMLTAGSRRFRAAGHCALLEYVAAGTILGGLIGALGPSFARDYLGQAYTALVPLWPGLAVLLFFRFVSGGLGVLLTATGQIGWRVSGQIVGIAATTASFLLFFASQGISAMPWIMSAGAFATSLSYAGAWINFRALHRIPQGFE